jgi:hypothetical protein
MNENIQNAIVKKTNNLTEAIKQNPNEVINNIEKLMFVLATNIANLQKKHQKQVLPLSNLFYITQKGGSDDKLIESSAFGVNLVDRTNVDTTTKALETSIKNTKSLIEEFEDAIKGAISSGDYDKVEKLQGFLEKEQKRQIQVEATKAASSAAAAATRSANAAAQLIEKDIQEKSHREIKKNLVNGARYSGLAGASVIIAKLGFAAPRVALAFGKLLASSSITFLVEAYNTAFANVVVSSVIGTSAINASEVYDNTINTVTQSEIGQVLGEESDNLFYLIVFINFGLLICLNIMLNKLSQVSDVRGLGFGISFQKELEGTKREDTIKILKASQQAAQAIAQPSQQAIAQPSQQAINSSSMQAIQDSQPIIEELEGGKKNKRKSKKHQRKSKKHQRKSKKHQRKSKKHQRKSKKHQRKSKKYQRKV